MPRLLTSLEWPRCSRKHDVAPNRVGSCTRNRAVMVEQSQLNPTGKTYTYDIHAHRCTRNIVPLYTVQYIIAIRYDINWYDIIMISILLYTICLRHWLSTKCHVAWPAWGYTAMPCQCWKPGEVDETRCHTENISFKNKTSLTQYHPSIFSILLHSLASYSDVFAWFWKKLNMWYHLVGGYSHSQHGRCYIDIECDKLKSGWV